MNLNDLKKLRRKAKDEENAQKGKNGRIGAPVKPLTDTQVKQSIEGLSQAILKLEGSVEGVRGNADGAHSQVLGVNRRVDLVMSESNRVFGDLEARTRELREELDILSESHISLVETLIAKGIIDPEPEEEPVKEKVADKDVVAPSTAENKIDVPTLEEMKEEDKKSPKKKEKKKEEK